MIKIGVIGVGSIAAAVVEGLCTSEIGDIRISLSPRNEERSRMLADRYQQVKRAPNNQQVLEECDIVLIAVRPADAEEVLTSLRFHQRHTVVSFVSLLHFEELKRLAAPAANVSRAIPLPSVVYHTCPIPIFNANSVVEQIFSHLGQPLKVSDEAQLHTLWTLTGLITAFYELLGNLSTWSESRGVERVVADKYIANMFHALTFMAHKKETINFIELAQHAATPNGMNEQAGKEIAAKGAHDIYKMACDHILRRFNP